jgi:Holliday junction DNA helicase RuvA
MIATLTGQVAEKIADIVVIDVQGVGYGVLVTTEDYSLLTTGNVVKVYVYEHIRENSHDLFGFVNLDTKQLFQQLLDVNGIGPKMALSVLSIGSANEVRRAIASGDVKFIQKANGVGKRVAERIVVDLKDKVGLVEALISLGYTPQDAAAALAHVPADLPTEERIKEALKRR